MVYPLRIYSTIISQLFLTTSQPVQETCFEILLAMNIYDLWLSLWPLLLYSNGLHCINTIQEATMTWFCHTIMTMTMWCLLMDCCNYVHLWVWIAIEQLLRAPWPKRDSWWQVSSLKLVICCKSATFKHAISYFFLQVPLYPHQILLFVFHDFFGLNPTRSPAYSHSKSHLIWFCLRLSKII